MLLCFGENVCQSLEHSSQYWYVKTAMFHMKHPHGEEQGKGIEGKSLMPYISDDENGDHDQQERREVLL